VELSGALVSAAGDHRPRVRRTVLAALGRIAAGELLGPRAPAVVRLVAGLEDNEPPVRAAAVENLAPLAAHHAEIREALDGVPLGAQLAPARCLLLEGCAELDRLQGAARTDEHPAARATALRRLAAMEQLDPGLRAAALEDPDPWVRVAALGAPELLEDPNPWVARLAMTRLASAARRALPADERRALAGRAASAADPWIRARACELLDAHDDDGLRLLLGLSHGRSSMVRAAAAEQLERCSDLPRRLERLLGEPDLPTPLRVAAYTFLLRGEDAVDRLAAALRGAAEPPEVMEHLRAVAVLHAGALRAAGIELPAPAQVAPRRRTRGHEARPEVELRRIGSTELRVAPLALSGAQGCRPSSLAHARQQGVNLFFWEPRYTALTSFLRRRGEDHELVVVAGTFHAHREGIEHDLELALRRLRRPRIDLFLLFWARSPRRLGAGPHDVLRRLKRAGRLGAIGFSTHDRALALDAIAEREWDAIMIRHNAAHRGAERQLLPTAEREGVGVLSFSALCYGRMLHPPGGVSAADCYRYSLEQPAVAACISAPRRHRELAHNIQVLREPALTAAARAALLARGREVYAEDTRFNALLRLGGGVSGDNVVVDPPPAAPELGEAWGEARWR
jgi:aryl-alcohol dehydrogenase-like predicted oxidoreductase